MPRAILRNGVFHPVEPLPAYWKDGREVWIQDIYEDDEEVDVEATDRWFEKLEALCADSNPHDEAIIQAAIDEQRKQGKLMMRREMGL